MKALIRTIAFLDKLKLKVTKRRLNIIVRAIEEPLRQIANAGLPVVFKGSSKKTNIGYDVSQMLGVERSRCVLTRQK